MSSLNPDKALVFRITHIANVPWILDHGLHCRNSPERDPAFREIGNPELIEKRAGREVPLPPGGLLSDYIPFYFTPYSPMLYNIITGYAGMMKTPAEEIVILASSLQRVAELGLSFVFSDRHAYLKTAAFSNSLTDLPSLIDWSLIRSRDFRRDPENPERFERYQAEALIHRHLPVAGLLGLACQNPAVAGRIQGALDSRAIQFKIVIKPDWYFR